MQQQNDDVGWIEDNNSEKSIKFCFQAALNLFPELENFGREVLRGLVGRSYMVNQS